MLAVIVSVLSVLMLAVIVVLMIGLHRQNERAARLLEKDDRER